MAETKAGELAVKMVASKVALMVGLLADKMADLKAACLAGMMVVE